LGPYDVLPMKTTIAFASVVNFAFLTTRRSAADASLMLSHPVSSPRVHEQAGCKLPSVPDTIRVVQAREMISKKRKTARC
jgi:hypothetical protein